MNSNSGGESSNINNERVECEIQAEGVVQKPTITAKAAATEELAITTGGETTNCEVVSKTQDMKVHDTIKTTL